MQQINVKHRIAPTHKWW